MMMRRTKEPAMSTLLTRKSRSAVGKLTANEAKELLAQVPGWEMLDAGGGELRRTFQFKNYYEAAAFVNATAWISHREDHHPDIELNYNSATLKYSTHSAGGLTENDFICAAKVNALLSI